jgi:DNA-binding transcriptional regulator YbjK
VGGIQLNNMDINSRAVSSATLANIVAKTSLALSHFTSDSKDANDDLDTVLQELQTLETVLDSLTQVLSRKFANSLPNALIQQLERSMGDCCGIVEKLEESLQKHGEAETQNTSKSGVFNKEKIEKICDCIELYRMSFALVLHITSM